MTPVTAPNNNKHCSCLAMANNNKPCPCLAMPSKLRPKPPAPG